ncbi:CAP domain-containing protein [Streptomyces sp. SKN60]|uniref:CAP domain-containing protein n=1 Tax=Streptomyces sp. SKN60 TaxID=2855506 RepID=UPI0022465810|nr:CAP domain-containing protein [Streptomyces sp. SKN60]
MQHDTYDRSRHTFRTTVIAAGTLAAALTVLTGMYAAGQAYPAASDRAAPVTAAAATVAQDVAQVVQLVNTERRKAGCAPLRSDPKLRTAAQGHADDMAARNYYAHAGRDGRNAGDRIKAAGYTWSAWGENIHRGPHSAAQAVDEWMNSAAHRENILDCSFEDIGVGVNLTGNGPWWVQDFASGR